MTENNDGWETILVIDKASFIIGLLIGLILATLIIWIF